MQGTSRSELAAELARTARLCEETAVVYAARDGLRTELVTSLLLASAAFETAAESRDPASPALLIAATLARDVIDAAEQRGLDVELLHCVAACRRVIELSG